MTDRDFKLLVREYFQVESNYIFNRDHTKREELLEKSKSLQNRILRELEDFTIKDVEELPFKD